MIEWAATTSPALDLTADATVGLLPVGATEQHGPHLPLGTDTIVATALCHAAAERVTGTTAVVLPAIPIGVSYGHGIRLPGTLSLTPELLAATVRQIVEWSAASELRRILIVNAHMGNSAALSTATDHLRLFRPDLQVGQIDWWSSTPDVFAEMTSDGEDVHANRAETSMMLAVAPDMVDLSLARDADDVDRTGDLVFRYTAESLSRNGVTGRPSEATSELGARLLAAASTEIARRLERGQAEAPPLGPGRAPLQPRNH